MKISKYKVYDSGTGIGAIGAQFAGGEFVGGGTADASVNWSGVPVPSIVEVSKAAAVTADVAWTETYTPAVFAAGNEWILTLEYADSRQKGRKVFKESYVAGDTATTVCDRFRAQVAASSLPLTGSGTTTLILTAVAGAGVNYVSTVGAVGTATFAASALTLDAQADTSARLSAKYDGVSASDFGSTTDQYDTYIVKYLDHVASSDGQIGSLASAALFIDQATATTALDDAINGNYTAVTEQDGAIAVGSV